MATTAKYPATLVALTDVGGEFPSVPNQELSLNADITNAVLSVVTTAPIPAYWPVTGWITIDSELLRYDSFTGSTFTINAAGRGVQSVYGGGVAAAHTAGAVIGLYLTAQAFNQVIAELVALEVQLGKQFMGRQTPVVAAATTAVDLSLGDTVPITLGANITTLTITNPITGHVYIFELIQDITGGRTITWPATFKWPGGTAPTLSAASKTDIVTAYWNGTSYLASSSLNY